MQVSVTVVEGLSTTVRSRPVVLPPAPALAQTWAWQPEEYRSMASIDMQHPASEDFILTYPDELILSNHRGEQMLYSTFVKKEHENDSSRCNFTVEGKRVSSTGSSGSFSGTMRVTIAYL